MTKTLITMTKKSFGCVGVINKGTKISRYNYRWRFKKKNEQQTYLILQPLNL